MDDLDLKPINTHMNDPKRELPKLTLKNLAMDVVNGVKALVIDPETSKVVAPVLFFAESIALKFIRNNVPYTEIDYSSYIQQIHSIEEGELNYNKIRGDTGPIVYPAGYVNVYVWMNWITEGMDDIPLGQRVFSYLYLGCLVLTMTSYFTAGSGSMPPWVLYLLALSKRLHSIYILRLFNDCWTTFCAIGTIVLLQQASYWKSSSKLISTILTYLAADMYSMAVSIKMNALLYLPAVIYLMYLLSDENLILLMGPVMFGILVQLGISWNFVLPFSTDSEAQEIRWAYLSQAYNFKRQFLYEWTVNWKIISEDTFSSSTFHNALLALHLFLLSFFLFTRWLRPTGKTATQFAKDASKFWKSTSYPGSVINDPCLGPKFVFVVMTTTNLIGVLCARSLHYQFLSWYVFSLPFLLWQTRLPFPLAITLFAIHEYCWNVYPSTAQSSGILLSTLCVTLGGLWFNSSQFDKTPVKKTL